MVRYLRMALAIPVFVVGPALLGAAEGKMITLVTLRSGFAVEADRVETSGENLILHHDGGSIQVAGDEIVSLEELLVPVAESPVGPGENGVAAQPVAPVQTLVRDAAARHGLPEAFVASVAQAESAMRQDAVSPKGARGVMQLMPDTARELGVNPNDTAENIDGGARLLRDLLIRYQNHPDQVRLALAAYNAGAGAVQKYNGVPPYRETVQYVERVLDRYRVKSRAVREPASGAASANATAGASQ